MHRRFVLGALAGGLMLPLGLSAAIAQPAPSPAGQNFTDQKRAVKRLRRTEKKLIKRRKRKAKELLKRRRDEHVRVHL